jgi:MYXO-CTERM domain-containing protein
MKSSSIPHNLLMGAAFAGLSMASAQAATVLTETTDFSDISNAPTDLTATFPDFLLDSGILGSISTGTAGSDFSDHVQVQMSPSASASIPYILSGSSTTSPSISMYLTAFSSSGLSLANAGFTSFPSGGSTSGTLDFTVPVDGIVRFSVDNEVGNAAMNYSIGAVPETGTAVLGLAGLAAAALRRRREQG